MAATPILFNIGALLALLAALSLLFKSEAVRGAGRVVLGVSSLLVGFHFVFTSLTFGGWLFVLSGLVTVGSGVRKYLRRSTAEVN